MAKKRGRPSAGLGKLPTRLRKRVEEAIDAQALSLRRIYDHWNVRRYMALSTFKMHATRRRSARRAWLDAQPRNSRSQSPPGSPAPKPPDGSQNLDALLLPLIIAACEFAQQKILRGDCKLYEASNLIGSIARLISAPQERLRAVDKRTADTPGLTRQDIIDLLDQHLRKEAS